ncbi:hypothetical protein B0H13DRAFT_2391335 [Mycena leptocephala]|nr:hypothetical protein B0H13DRAFT_2391335 [Mycena leptocephala]
MSSAEIVKALGPGNKLSRLHQLSSSYKTATESFTNLLLYPFLQSIVLGDPNNGKSNEEDLRTIVVDGSSRFGQLCTSNISIAQQVNSYGKVVPVLLKGETIAKYTTYATPLIEKYVAEAEASGNENKQFFKEFQTYISTVDQQIALMATKVAELIIDIEKAKSELGNANVGTVLRNLLKTFFKIGSGEDGNVQIATLLSVGIDTPKSSFTQVWTNQQRLTALIKGLTELKDTLTAVKKLVSKLSGALTGVLSDAKALPSTWSDVQTRFGEVETMDRMVTDTELTQIAAEWTKAQEAATAYVDAVSGSGATRAVPTRALIDEATAAVAHHMPKVPRTQGELKMARLITSLNINAQGGNTKVNDSDRDKLVKAAGPPEQTKAVLEDLVLQISRIMEQFETLLLISYLNQLKCTNPDKPSERIEVRILLMQYEKMYWDLQQETVPIAQDLQSYSKTVLHLLPGLVSTPSGQPGEVLVDAYLKVHKALASDYDLKATEVFNKSLTYRNRWNNVIIAIEQAISESMTNIENWEQDIGDLTDEVRQQTFVVILTGIGALRCFSSAAMIPGGVLVAGGLVAGGIFLMNMTVAAIDEIGKLPFAIDELKRAIQTAKDALEELVLVRYLMQKIADSLTDVVSIWANITQGLDDVGAWHSLLDIPGLLDIVKPELIASWISIRKAAKRYINIATGVRIHSRQDPANLDQ